MSERLHGRHTRLARIGAAIAVACSNLVGPAASHPHSTLELSIAVLFDDLGRISGFEEVWSFDGTFSQEMAVVADTDFDNALSERELTEIGATILDSAAPYSYYNRLEVDGGQVLFVAPAEFSVSFDANLELMSLRFRLDLVEPVAPAVVSPLFLNDPYQDFVIVFGDDEPVRLVNAPPGYKAVVNRFRQEVTFANASGG